MRSWHIFITATEHETGSPSTYSRVCEAEDAQAAAQMTLAGDWITYHPIDLFVYPSEACQRFRPTRVEYKAVPYGEL